MKLYSQTLKIVFRGVLIVFKGIPGFIYNFKYFFISCVRVELLKQIIFIYFLIIKYIYYILNIQYISQKGQKPLNRGTKTTIKGDKNH